MILISLLLSSVVAFAQIIDPIKVNAREFCQNLKSEKKIAAKFMARALRTNEDLDASGSPGDALHRLGFNNLLEDDSELLKHPAKIPLGSVLVSNCEGPLAIKCGEDSFLMDGTTEKKFRQLKANCIKAIMYTEDFK